MLRLRLTFVIPVVLAGLIGGFIGRTVAQVGCHEAACNALTVPLVMLASGLVAATGVGIVVVLADRSLREWHAENRPPPSSPNGDSDDDRTDR